MYASLSGIIQLYSQIVSIFAEMENTLRKDREHKEHLAQQKAKLGEI